MASPEAFGVRIGSDGVNIHRVWGRIGSDGARIRSNRVRIGSLGTSFLLTTPSFATDAVSLTAALQPYSGLCGGGKFLQ